MAEWVWYAVDMSSSTIVSELVLTDFSGEVSLGAAGAMSAKVPLGDMTAAERAAAIQVTEPARFGVLAVRNGLVMGEWIIWKRSRDAGSTSVLISGSETISILDHRIMHQWDYPGWDQLTIAHDLFAWGFNAFGGSPAVTVPTPAASGVIRDRFYKDIDGFIGTRVRELSQVQNGFEYYLTTTMSLAGTATVGRTVNYYYPRAGSDTSMVFELAGTETPAGGNVVTTSVDEDGTRLASSVFSTGANTGQTALNGYYTDTALVAAGYLYLERITSNSTVVTQSVINAYARGGWDDSQTAFQPNGLVVFADQVPVLGDYRLGDRVGLYIEPTVLFPAGGYTALVRVVGWTLKPGSAGAETVTLTIVEA